MRSFTLLLFRMGLVLVSSVVLLVSGCNSGDPFKDPIPASISVASVSPVEKAVNVALDTSVVVSFAQAVNPDSLTASNFIVSRKKSGTTISGKITYDAASLKATLTPYQSLKPGEQYEVVLNQIKGASGEFLAPHVFEFSTASLLQVLSVSPQPESGGIPVTGASRRDIEILFSDSLDVSKISEADFFAWEQSEGDSLPTTLDAQIVWNESARTLSLKPRKGRLKYSHTYRVVLRRATSLNGSVAEPTEWEFETVKARVSATTPSNGATGILTDVPITLSFPIPVDRETVPGNIHLKDAQGLQEEFVFARPFTYQENSGTVVTLPIGDDDESHLNRGTRYELIVDGVYSTDGERFQRLQIWFDTVQ